MMYDQEEMDRLHEILLEMMSDIHEAFTSESVDYYVVGGAAIGLLRNGDLVPWDDDIDIVFFRKDRDRIRDALLRHLSEKYIVEIPNSRENHKGYLRVVKRDTCLIRSFKDRNDRGICIELFEMIDVPPNGISRSLINLVSRNNILFNMAGDYVPRFLIPVCIGMRRIGMSIADRIASKHSYDLVAPMNKCFFDEIVPKEVFGTPKEMSIKGHRMMFPEKLDEYLRIVYGDYMSLPPEECRMPSYLILDTEHSWKEYSKDDLKS